MIRKVTFTGGVHKKVEMVMTPSKRSPDYHGVAVNFPWLETLGWACRSGILQQKNLRILLASRRWRVHPTWSGKISFEEESGILNLCLLFRIC